MKHCIIEDSSFVIALMYKEDCRHNDAVFIFKKFWQYRDQIKIIIPSFVFFETIITLAEKGIDLQTVKTKLWNLLRYPEVISLHPSEMSAFNLCDNIPKIIDAVEQSEYTAMPGAIDYIISQLGIDFDAQILTFDSNMRKKIALIYPKIYYCSPDKKDGLPNETIKFLQDFSTEI